MNSEVVARIAYHASDTLVDLSPPFPASSSFRPTFSSLSNASRHNPTIITVPNGGDPAATLLRVQSPRLVSFTATSDAQTPIKLIMRIVELAELPLVLHFAVENDLSDVLLLRSAIPFFLLSTTTQQAHDNALLASKLARKESKAVVHVFYAASASQDPVQVPDDKILPFVLDTSHSVTPAVNGKVNGHKDHVPNGVDSHDPLSKLYKAYEQTALSTLSLVRRPSKPLAKTGSPDSQTVIFVLGQFVLPEKVDGVAFVTVSLANPIPPTTILSAISPSVTRVIVLEQAHRWSMKWTPLYLDVANALQLQEREQRPIVQSGLLGESSHLTSADILEFVDKATNASPSDRLLLGAALSVLPATEASPHVPKHELSYTTILTHLFGQRLEISNSPSLVPTQGKLATSPEFALGRIRGQLEHRASLVSAVEELLRHGDLDTVLHGLLTQWLLAKNDAIKSRLLGKDIVARLQASPITHPAAENVLALREHFSALSRWIIGSDAWSYDLGSSGLHHAIASGINMNILILDTLPYSARNSADPHRRKRDVGLYAMNHGDVYVASVAVYSSYAQVLQALVEADKFNGPSVVLAYLPYESENSLALDVLKETKLAVDAGYWPLYRWDPSKEKAGKEPFVLDSDAVKNDLQQFLDRQNHLSQLVRSKPELRVGAQARRNKVQQSYKNLLVALDAPPLLVLYASDGGAAEKIAKRLVNRGKTRGLEVTLATLDSMTLESLAQEEHVVFITSTAGQGEPPQNGRQFFKSMNAAVTRGDVSLSKLQFSVFAMGDSHYWPRPEDVHYYNKPGKDLDARLEKLGGHRFVDLGLGDDQDSDGPATGYKLWEPLLWKAMGVDAVEVTEAEPETITNEHIKAASHYLRGTILEGLEDTTTGAIAPSDGQLTKFHGIYQQDDRDIRDERQAQGVEPAYSFMIRVRMPGGVCLPNQWLKMDQIADEHGSGTFKITTRQTFQFHGVIKRHLKPAIQDINRALLDTLAACGDVNRNVICSSIPSLSKLHAQVFEFSKNVSEHLIPRTTAYHEIWLDKKLVAGEAVKDFEPLYGEFYLPRKFKIAVAVPPTNDVDVFANDLGFIAIVEDGALSGFNVTIGGGMGVTHGNKKTYPRIGDQGKYVAEAVMLSQNARLKYTIDRMGLDVFKAEVEKRLGYPLLPARPYTFDRNIDDFGWHIGEDGKHHVTLFIENGRIQDEPGRDFKTGLREIAKIHKGSFRLTTNQHILVSDIASEDVAVIKALLAKYKLDNLAYSGLRLSSSACVAFPTCGFVDMVSLSFLDLTSFIQYLPLLIDKVEKICEENGLRNDSIVMRMTGCPNGCARPYVAEVAFVGKAPGTYLMLLGGGYYEPSKKRSQSPEILAILGPMIKRYALERLEGERFGDFTIRAGYIAPTTSGIEWYDNMGN
ncbi:hypothetical protein C8J56DRAFT_1007302 [Mycena floridula]|nr:hypothetical protein C8J56DRAFT_1007302 [Mycena floridula]